MTSWVSVKAEINNKEKAPTENDIESYVEQLSSTRASKDPSLSRLYSNENELFFSVTNAEIKQLISFMVRQDSEAFGVIAIGEGNDTGPHPDRVKFYEFDERGDLEHQKSDECPTRYKELSISSTR